MSVCKLCAAAGNPEANCAFRDGVFKADNDLCGTALAIRDMAYEGRDVRPVVWADDSQYITVPVEQAIYDYNEGLYDVLVVGWYKWRTRINTLLLLGELLDPRPPTEGECLAILEASSRRPERHMWLA